MSKRTVLPLSLILLTLSGCETQSTLDHSEQLHLNGDINGSVDVLQAQAKKNPKDAKLRTAMYGKTELLVSHYSREANAALIRGDDAGAIRALQTLLKYDPANLGARQQIQSVQSMVYLRPMLAQANAIKQSNPQEALRQVRQIIAQKPNYTEAVELRDALTRELVKADNLNPKLSSAMQKPVSLSFTSQSLTTIFETISQMSGINFIVDKDIDPNAMASISAPRTTAEDALNLLLSTNQLQKKILNANTILIYPSRPDKDRLYRELAVRTFYLSHADPKVAAAEIKQILKPKEVLVDERLSAVIVRDGLDTLSAVEKLVQAIDIAQSEVTVDIQVLEVSLADEQSLGISYPEGIGLSVGNFGDLVGGAVGTSLSQLGGLNSSNILLDSGSTSVRVNALLRSGNTVTLANPRVRVKNRESAQVSIGDKIPVITSTTANLVTTSSVSYQDVGLKIDLKPNVSLNDEISLDMQIDMSHITKRIPGTETVPATFELGSRSTKTTLTARNNETQIVSGLIRTADTENVGGIPGLSKIPWIGKYLFGSTDAVKERTEIILLITPRIERNLDLPMSQVSTFSSGTEARSSTEGLVLRNSANLSLKSEGPPSTGLPPPLQQSDVNWQALPPPVQQSSMDQAGGAPAPATPPPMTTTTTTTTVVPAPVPPSPQP
ncbi:secretin and TonB N-terminal domain-containing protein [Pseudomonas sp.]|uniref:secretin and TonB N-terminal domain-containing protein n=1 Tax=Pseudomonas sp. TaxID=306 RepID=UPI0026332765|nr:secretin and TonB N-terminal domain-containing protein [Pseudomonas sp.]